MKFARWTFGLAAAWGFLILGAFYFNEANPALVPAPFPNHPDYYFGFLGVGLAWQAAFVIVALDPVKYRLFMLPALFEKFSYVLTLSVLFLVHQLSGQMLGAAVLDGTFGLLFLVSFLKTRLAGKKAKRK